MPRGALLVLAIVAAVALASRAWWIYGTRRFTTVSPGRLFRSGALGPRRLPGVVRRHGIRTVIDLQRSTDDAAAERAQLDALGVASVHLPMKQTPAPAAVTAFLEAVERAEKPVLIHCQHGAGRARVFSAIYLMEFEGWSNARAAAILPIYARRKRAFLRAYRPQARLDAAGLPAGAQPLRGAARPG